MDSFQKMRARDRVMSSAPVGDAARAGAVFDAGIALDDARRTLKRARANEQMDATSARRTGISPAEQKSVQAVANASRLVEEATANLEAELSLSANTLIKLEELQLRLATAESELKRALEVRQEIKEQFGQTDAKRTNDARGVQQVDWVASDEAVAELDTAEGCVTAAVRAYEKFARRQLLGK